MSNTALLKGQRITSPGGPGEVIEIIGDKVVVKLDNEETKTFASDEITDDSNAG
jgi:preprotein translocase subunit YajC